MKLKDLRISSLCVLLAASLVAPSAYAAPPATTADTAATADTDEARLRFQRGVELYESGDVQAAYIEFKRAYALAPRYQLLFNIAQAQAELKDYVGALASLSQYLEEGGHEISQERSLAVSKEMKRLQTYIAYVQLNISVKGAQIRVDGELVQQSSPGSGIAVSAGRRKIEVLHKDYLPWERYVDVAGEDQIALDAMLVARSKEPSKAAVAPKQPKAVAPPLREPPPKRSGPGPLFWSGVAATAVFGASSAVLGGLTLGARNDHRQTLRTAPLTQDKLDRSARKVKHLALATDIGLILTASATAFTVAAYFWEVKKKRRNERERIQTAISPGGFAVQGRF